MLRAYTDGACDNNKNIAGCGVIIYKGENIIFESSFYLSTLSTSNEAEYKALIECLEFCNKYLKGETITIHLDSQLVVRQYNRIYRCKKDTLKPLLKRCLDLSKGFNPVLMWIPREENEIADKLSKDGLNNFYND